MKSIQTILYRLLVGAVALALVPGSAANVTPAYAAFSTTPWRICQLQIIP